MAKVVLGMSGGVDSSVAALLLRRAGHEVVGVMLQMDGDIPRPQDVEAFRSVVSAIGMESRVVPCPYFIDVMRASALEYARGRTPNPCCLCNPAAKFRSLVEFADSIGAGYVATGHYARVESGNLLKGIDAEKDQSYFLYRLEPGVLSRLMLPLGNLRKVEVRRLATEAGLPVASRPDSQDVCFEVDGERCGETLLRRCKMQSRPGDIVFQGKPVGRHDGIETCTIGQRSGLGVALGVPAYVSRIDASVNEVELTTDPSVLDSRRILLGDVVLHGDVPESADVRIRYRSRAVRCRIEKTENGLALMAETPFHAAACGQSGVIYSGDRVVGGGVIEQAGD